MFHLYLTVPVQIIIPTYFAFNISICLQAAPGALSITPSATLAAACPGTPGRPLGRANSLWALLVFEVLARAEVLFIVLGIFQVSDTVSKSSSESVSTTWAVSKCLPGAPAGKSFARRDCPGTFGCRCCCGPAAEVIG